LLLHQIGCPLTGSSEQEQQAVSAATPGREDVSDGNAASPQVSLLVCSVTLDRERERNFLQSGHLSLWGHSTYDRLIGRGAPRVSFDSRWCTISLFGLPQGESSGRHDCKGRGIEFPCSLPLEHLHQYFLSYEICLINARHARILICHFRCSGNIYIYIYMYMYIRA